MPKIMTISLGISAGLGTADVTGILGVILLIAYQSAGVQVIRCHVRH